MSNIAQRNTNIFHLVSFPNDDFGETISNDRKHILSKDEYGNNIEGRQTLKTRLKRETLFDLIWLINIKKTNVQNY